MSSISGDVFLWMNLHPQNLMALKPYDLNSTLKMTFKDAGFNIHTFQTNDEGFSDKIKSEEGQAVLKHHSFLCCTAKIKLSSHIFRMLIVQKSLK